MALVSPGLQITVTDESQYVSAAVGTVPLIVLATEQDKIVNGSAATGTSAANAGKLQVFGSQRELVAAMGYPSFKQTSAGTPIHGDERNEYGLMAAYSALGVGNRVYAIRADIDLAQLAATNGTRPNGIVADSTYWLDLADTDWGIFEWDAANQTFRAKTPILITSADDTFTADYDGLLVDEPTPISSIGQIGSYAVVATTAANRVFYKARDNVWYPIGSTDWQAAWPTVTGTPVVAEANGYTTSESIFINTQEVVISGTALSDVVDAINDSSITGISAAAVNSKIEIYVTSLSESNGSDTDGKVTLAAGTGGLLADLGLTADTYNGLGINGITTPSYGTYASVPQWDENGSFPAPSGAVWLKTGALGGGSNFIFKKYNALTDQWTTQSATAYSSSAAAIYGLDPAGGGANIAAGAIFLLQDPNLVGTATPYMGGWRPFVRTTTGVVTATADSAPSAFTVGDAVNIFATEPGYSGYNQTNPAGAGVAYSVVMTGSTATSFVADVLAANIPYVTASVNSAGAISITHRAGGIVQLARVTGDQDIPTVAGFVDGVTNVVALGSSKLITGWNPLEYQASIAEPTANPTDGTLWYYSDATEIDIMINTGSAWKGYRTLASDARGYNLVNTDPSGVIVSATQPTSQSDTTSLVQGDLWLDTSDLENFPKLSRYNGSRWIAIDNTDQISQNGIVFADARWDTGGTVDPVSDAIPAVSDLLLSDYTDLDCPDPQLYPRGMLMFNTRRSGYNVKRFVSDYFSYDNYSSSVDVWSVSDTYAAGEVISYGTQLYVSASGSNTGNTPSGSSVYWSELQAEAWVTASGNKSDGSMYAGHQAQRAMIVESIKAAVDGNTQIREDQFQFNLIVAPGYPEAISNMVALNNDRANTAFVIGDTPMTLSTNVVELTNWSNGVTEGGLTTADPYLAVYYPSALSTDVSGNPIMVPPSHMALRTYIRNDNLAYQWFAPAGVRRGLVDNVTDLGYLNAATGEFQRTGVSQSLRDSLYIININPVTVISGTGVVVWGQKTRNPTTSAMDRVNVARLVNYIRTILAKTGNGFLFEPNDKITRDQLKSIIESALNDLVAKRGIYDYLVVCDNSNNTADRIARNELYVDIAIEPMKDVEFIYIPIRLLNPGSIGNLGS
jgi:hypothetical protein